MYPTGIGIDLVEMSLTIGGHALGCLLVLEVYLQEVIGYSFLGGSCRGHSQLFSEGWGPFSRGYLALKRV